MIDDELSEYYLELAQHSLNEEPFFRQYSEAILTLLKRVKELESSRNLG